MPRRLLERCRPDSIREFRTAAGRRYDDGLTAAAGGRGLAAVYLWGYAAEMLLKAGYFAVLGVGPDAPLAMNTHISPAIKRGGQLGIGWPPKGAGHNVRAWAELLVLERAAHPDPTMAYEQDLADQVSANGRRVGRLWNETLRYHKNTPYQFEVVQVRSAVEWFLTKAALL